MICNVCGAQEATIHLTEIVNDQMMEIHLCEACAQEKGTDFKTHFNLSDLLAGLAETGKTSKTGEKKFAGKCPNCGMTYDEFGKIGRLGCAECYQAFSKFLTPLIKRVQRSTQHNGKIPSRFKGSLPAAHAPAAPSEPAAPAKSQLQILQEKLKKSIHGENFEDAARLRDEIRKLEEKADKGKP